MEAGMMKDIEDALQAFATTILSQVRWDFN